MSSGNLTADRRLAYAQSLKAAGDAKAAAEVAAQALELTPAWAEGRFALAEMLAAAGEKQEAIAAYRAYLATDPADSMGAGVRLALLGAQDAPADLPAAYLRRLFDEYAPRFDKSLMENLAYRGPAILKGAVTRIAPGPFRRTFDLGCGTGLSGAAFRDLTAWLGGADLSPEMVKKARAKGIYDEIAAQDLRAGLAALAAPCDLVIAADVLVYVGDLVPVFAAVREKLDGAFALTLQKGACETYALGPEQRYGHAPAYVRAVAQETGFRVALLEDAVTRQEAGKDVPGLVAVLV